MTVKPIPTRYAGCHFHSRLEARWAVFLDHLRIRWEYEPQGFEVTRGRYLPDFYLPDIGKWMEVKASVGRISHREWGLMQDFGNEVAMPKDKFSIVFSIPEPGKPPAPLIWTVAWTGPAPRKLFPGDEFGATVGDEFYPASPDLVDACAHTHAGFLPALWVIGNSQEINGALTAARSARFEHGQAGA